MGAELLAPIAMWGAIALVVLVFLWWLQRMLRDRGRVDEKLDVQEAEDEKQVTFDRRKGEWRAGGGLAGRMRDRRDGDS